jgi:4,5-dihydroxyphthalate decarboxylase
LWRGRHSLGGYPIELSELSFEERFRRAGRDELDLAELSLASYLINRSRGDRRLLALPIFLSRSFRHHSLYVASNGGIDSPEQLVGREVGVEQYQKTANVWIRGILRDEYGIRPTDLRWRSGGLDRPTASAERVPLKGDLATRVKPLGPDCSLTEALLDGSLAAIMSPIEPDAHWRTDRIRRLFPEYWQHEQRYFERTKIFPIMHVLTMRQSLLEQSPELATAVCEAFDDGLRSALRRIRTTDSPAVASAWIQRTIEHEQRVLGPNAWSYGYSANAATIGKLIEYLELDELVEPGSLTTETAVWQWEPGSSLAEELRGSAAAG